MRSEQTGKREPDRIVQMNDAPIRSIQTYDPSAQKSTFPYETVTDRAAGKTTASQPFEGDRYVRPSNASRGLRPKQHHRKSQISGYEGNAFRLARKICRECKSATYRPKSRRPNRTRIFSAVREVN